MKKSTLSTILAAGTIAVGGLSIASQPSQAQSTTFVCETTGGTPTTYAVTPRGYVPVIRWVSHHFSGSGYTPQQRCAEVTSRFQTYYNDGSLNFITTGIMNDQPVVCVTGTYGGSCTGLLFTLKQGENASRVIQQLFDVRVGASGPLYESTNGGASNSNSPIYIDMNEYLNNTAVDPAASGNTQSTPSNSPTTNPTNSNSPTTSNSPQTPTSNW